MAPTPRNLHIDRYLTNISIDFAQDADAWVSRSAFPVVPVQKQSDKYVIYRKGTFWRDTFPVRPLGGEADVAMWDKDEGLYYAEERALAHRIDDRQRANADEPINMDRRAVKLLTERMMVNSDRRWTESFFGPNIWGTDLTGTDSNPGSDEFLQFNESGSDPVAIIDEAKEQMARTTGRTPNRLIVGARVHRILRNNAEIRDMIKYTQRAGPISGNLLSELFEIDEYKVARSVFNDASEGQADDIDFIVPDNSMLFVYTPASPGIDTPSAGYTFAWTGLLDGANALGTAVMRGRAEFSHSDHFEVRNATDMRVVSPELGIFFEDAVANNA